ncbi:hypothetical protein JTB14_004823 [Gonioctena quinquepunctata]|nr:hypothetical protein JTB14_004823 [Gonioctena quinquepunctata]
MFVLLSVLLGLLCFPSGALPTENAKRPFQISVIHFNDFHARFDQTNDNGGTCKKTNECVGGVSRLYTQIKRLREENPKAILLNAGDTFQGTLFYTIGRWNITQQFMNKLNIDAEVLGNHDFDDGITGAVSYMKALNHPIVVSNIDDSSEPNFAGNYRKSIIIERDGKKIGIIGVTTFFCADLSNTGNLKFLPVSPSVNEEAERLVREEGVFTNIVLSHAGYEVEHDIAKNASKKIGLIVGGHSHTFLYSGDPPPGTETVMGPYPTIVESKHGKKVLLVQSAAFNRYLGNITVSFDNNGEVCDYSGAPIYLDSSVPQDEGINQDLLPWKELVDKQGGKIIGSTLVDLSNIDCFRKECTLGNFITDATVYAFTKSPSPGSWSDAAIAVINAGGLRTGLEIGNITYSDMLVSQPFANTYQMGEIEGRYLKEMLEFSTQDLLQVSGMKVVMNLSLPENERVSSVQVRCQNCTIPRYEELDMNKVYRLAVCSFLRNGGNGFTMLKDHMKNVRVGPLDIDALTDYLAHRSPVFQEEEGRIITYGSTTRRRFGTEITGGGS